MLPIAKRISISSEERHKIADAVARLGYRVTAADIATKTGIALNLTDMILKELAAQSGGCMEVDESGEIVYRLPPGFRNVFLGRRLKAAAKPFVVPAIRLASYIFRSFMAIMLMFSPVSLLGVIMAVLGSESTRRGEQLALAYLSPFLSLFRWRYHPGDVDHYPSFLQSIPEDNTSFAYDIVTFLLGADYGKKKEKDRKWRYIAALIRKNSGVVTAEQLAPFAGSGAIDGSGVITQILAHFDGHPAVTSSGNTVYVFPSLQVSTNESAASELPDLLVEQPIRFSTAKGSRLTFLWMFAIMNFFFFMPMALSLNWFGSASAFAIFLYLYTAFGIIFCLVPTIRLVCTLVSNWMISYRNARRRSSLELVESPSDELLKKLDEAKKFGHELTHVDGTQLEYHTDANLLDQEFEQILPEYANQQRPVTIEPEQQNSIKALERALDQDSIVLINPPAGQTGLALLGRYQNRRVLILIEQTNWDYDLVRVSMSCESGGIFVEIARPVSDKFISRACIANSNRMKLKTLIPRLMAYSPKSKKIPGWLIEKKDFSKNMARIFRSHHLQRLVIKDGIRSIQKVSSISRVDDLLYQLLELSSIIEQELSEREKATLESPDSVLELESADSDEKIYEGTGDAENLDPDFDSVSDSDIQSEARKTS